MTSFGIFTVEAVINHPDFFSSGSSYFYGVWGQAAWGTEGQQMILKALAPYPEGLSLEELMMQLHKIVGETLDDYLL